jgi:ectoine hydroxylase-related dioxygenase (phytanoyl-CoA dioxygenase family)
MPDQDIAAYHRMGYQLIDVFPESEAVRIREQIDAILDQHGQMSTADRAFHSSENQHRGDAISSFRAKTKHYYFHLLTNELFIPIQEVFHRPEILHAIGRILGAPLIINNASLFAAEPGTSYKLGWHRDVIQIPQDEIDEGAIYNPDRFHNSVQINLPLYDDETLWVVPGSHHRRNTAAEAEAFSGSKHYAPIHAEMPGGIKVTIRPGQAVLYNNTIIHRGYHPAFVVPRRSLHMGYHCAAKPPTWHFYLLDESQFTTAYRARMTPTVRAMINAYFECRKAYPRMEDTWVCRRSFRD